MSIRKPALRDKPLHLRTPELLVEHYVAASGGSMCQLASNLTNWCALVESVYGIGKTMSNLMDDCPQLILEAFKARGTTDVFDLFSPRVNLENVYDTMLAYDTPYLNAHYFDYAVYLSRHYYQVFDSDGKMVSRFSKALGIIEAPAPEQFQIVEGVLPSEGQISDVRDVDYDSFLLLSTQCSSPVPLLPKCKPYDNGRVGRKILGPVAILGESSYDTILVLGSGKHKHMSRSLQERFPLAKIYDTDVAHTHNIIDVLAVKRPPVYSIVQERLCRVLCPHTVLECTANPCLVCVPRNAGEFSLVISDVASDRNHRKRQDWLDKQDRLFVGGYLTAMSSNNENGSAIVKVVQPTSPMLLQLIALATRHYREVSLARSDASSCFNSECFLLCHRRRPWSEIMAHDIKKLCLALFDHHVSGVESPWVTVPNAVLHMTNSLLLDTFVRMRGVASLLAMYAGGSQPHYAPACSVCATNQGVIKLSPVPHDPEPYKARVAQALVWLRNPSVTDHPVWFRQVCSRLEEKRMVRKARSLPTK